MPRLVGKKRNHLPSTLFVFFLGLMIGGGAVGEYAGLYDYIPKFGEASPDQQVLTNRAQ
ncbi:MAG: hypothetical protein HC810_05800 [Acaryochloridaceae cyanobacterium RL_2_7]|nr:hypothetical protein [Acaryochloridaceae cyanobacterium RL_2_7]